MPDATSPKPRTPAAASPGHSGQPSAEAANVPRVRVAEALRQPAEPDLDAVPRSGEVWRLECDDVTSVVVVVKVEDDDATVAPIGEDAHLADPATLLVEADEAPLGFAVGVWVGLEAVVPLFVFDRRLGELAAMGDLEALRRRVRTGVGEPPAHRRRPPPVTSDIDPRVRYRDALRADLLALAATARLRSVPVGGPDVSVGEALRRAQLSPGQVAADLHWPRDRARRVFDDAVVASEEEAVTLAHRYGLGDDAVEALTHVPAPLLILLHRPRWRHEVRAWAQPRELPEAVARRRVAEEAVASRLRSAGGRPGDDAADQSGWEAVLEAFFRSAT